ncbi:hypothetical protein ATO10_08673 [Actibacterium atlanticum]|uniref:C factor, cell signaling protein n=2 Tax=Actibacterium atlanticum TaxID=1461693 RepID=A0A058ZM63_9RHOB|nr:SDR family NAD(P)-dependent oxidoreductase [Actibacterium atlanticum]KCV81906.1 hypothetical protein ATO10_08673 [Actibacterium atlanticum]
MQKALILGASGGIGGAVAAQLARQGWSVDGLSRKADGFDVTDPQAVASQLERLQGTYDLVFIATGQLHGAGHPPEKSLRALSAEAMADQFVVNAIGPALVMRHAQRLLPRDRRAVLAVLSARVGSITDNRLGGWYSYRMAKAALNQALRTSSVEIARTHPKAICVALHPGTVQTEFTKDYTARHSTVKPAQAARNLINVIEGLTPGNTGQFFDWAGKPVPW